MKHPYRAGLLCALLAVLIAPAYFAAASPLGWPDQPPEKATISGPGIQGEVAVRDQDVLNSLKLGVFEDFNSPITPPAPKAGYTITRWFYGGTFKFGILHYYPNAGGRGYILFEDGPQLSGDHTAYDQRWFHASAVGDQSMQRLLALVAPQATESASPVAVQPVVAVGLGAALLVLVLLAMWAALRRRGRMALSDTGS